MKKIAIFTIRSRNFGNRLQNYALQSVICKLGYDCVTLQSRTIDSQVEEVLSYRTQMKNVKFLLKMYLKHKYFFRKLLNKADGFDEFDSKYIYESSDCISTSFITKGIEKKYYAFVAGSDQIWNTNFDFVSTNYFLPFIHSKKISYAASFGGETIPYNQQISDCLKSFKRISVREKSGIGIIKDIADRDATLLVDPTMLLSAEEWKKLEKKPANITSQYILTYFLSPKCQEAKETVNKLSKDYSICELNNLNVKELRKAGPSEFLWLFDHANLIITDSFHACVFSFLFNKPFVVYDRNWNEGNMNSRLNTLLELFHLERKYANSGLKNDIWEHDYTEGYKQLDIERERATSFLKKALED